jgi:peptide/nickel transport system substrate-binding protein
MAGTSTPGRGTSTPSRLRWLLTLIGLGLVLVAAGCGSGGDDESSSTTEGGGDSGQVEAADPIVGGALTYGISSETDGWLPSSNRWGPSAFNVARALYDPLTVIDTDGVAQAYLLESIEPTDDTLREWKLTVREGVTYHNGETMTKEDLATFIKTMQLAPLTSFAFGPVDAVGVIPDENAIVVIMNQPWGTFPAILSAQPGYMIHPGLFDGSIEATEPVGTGPFEWGEWVIDDHLTLTKYDNYWREDLPYLETVTFKPLVDPATRRAALQAGDIDMLHSNIPADAIDAGRDGEGVEDGFQVVFDGSSGDEQHIVLNTQSGPTADLEIRRALALATDREAINDGLYDGFFEIASSPYAPNEAWYSDPGWPDPDPDEAAAIVEEWEAENGPLELSLVVISNQTTLQLSQAIQEQWNEVGIDVSIEAEDEANFSNRLLFGDFDAIQTTFFNRSDPDEMFHFWDPEAVTDPGELSLNFPRYASDLMFDNLHAARETDDFDVRKELYDEVWEDWAMNFPYLFLYHAPYILLARDNVENLDTFTFPDGEPAEAMDWGAVFLTDVWLSN